MNKRWKRRKNFTQGFGTSTRRACAFTTKWI
nr:MAG TPA: hypothetical protein [Caudoviricetes sp.]